MRNNFLLNDNRKSRTWDEIIKRIKIPFLKTHSEYCLLLSFHAKYFRWSSGPRMDTETTPEYWWTIPILFMSSFGQDPIIYPLLINYSAPLINRLIWITSTRLRQECPFYVLSRLVSKVVSDFWEGGLGRCCAPSLEVMVQVSLWQPKVRNHLSTVTPGLASSAVHEVQGPRWKGIAHEEKGKEHSVSFDKQ